MYYQGSFDVLVCLPRQRIFSEFEFLKTSVWDLFLKLWSSWPQRCYEEDCMCIDRSDKEKHSVSVSHALA